MPGSFRVVGLLLVGLVAITFAQVNPPRPNRRADRIKELSKQLSWQDKASRDRYLAGKDVTTEQALAELDEFITESFVSTTEAGSIKEELDNLFGHSAATGSQNVAFLVNLTGRRFLIVGVEMPRGGLAISENLVSFRAYRVQGTQFKFVAASEYLHSSDEKNEALSALHAQRLPMTPVDGEAWFVTWAMVPPRSPYTVALRLFAFDGQKFLTLWAPRDIVVKSLSDAVNVAQSGFTVNALFAADGNPSHAEEIRHEQFVLTADGPQQIAEWRTPIQ